MLRCLSERYCSIFSLDRTISAPTNTSDRFQWYLQVIENRFTAVERLWHSYSLINIPKIWKMSTTETREGDFYVYYEPPQDSSGVSLCRTIFSKTRCTSSVWHIAGVAKHNRIARNNNNNIGHTIVKWTSGIQHESSWAKNKNRF